jgi:hypothetical protein
MTIPYLTNPANERLPCTQLTPSAFYSEYQPTEDEIWIYRNLSVIPKENSLLGPKIKKNNKNINKKEK